MIIDAKIDPDQLPEFSRRDPHPHASATRAYSVPATQEVPGYNSFLLPPPPLRGLRTTGSTPDLRLQVVESPTGTSASSTINGASSSKGPGSWQGNSSSLKMDLMPLHFLQKGSLAITGTYHIDPRTSAVDFDSTRGLQSKKSSHPQASFRTKHGEINVSLSTVGRAKRDGSKVDVLVASWSGNITVKLLTPEIDDPIIGLEMFSVRGDILLLLPPSYRGMFHLKTHWGSLKFLPRFKNTMKVIHETETEAIVMAGDHFVADQSPTNFAQMKSRFGNIIIGINGVDTHNFKNGFWQSVMKKL